MLSAAQQNSHVNLDQQSNMVSILTAHNKHYEGDGLLQGQQRQMDGQVTFYALNTKSIC